MLNTRTNEKSDVINSRGEILEVHADNYICQEVKRNKDHERKINDASLEDENKHRHSEKLLLNMLNSQVLYLINTYEYSYNIWMYCTTHISNQSVKNKLTMHKT